MDNADLIIQGGRNGFFFDASPTNQSFSSGVISSAGWTITGDGELQTRAGTTVKVEKKPNMPVKVFFGLMKKKMGILKDHSYKSRIKKLADAVDEAIKNGQIAFSEELLSKLFVLAREAEMWAMGKKIFLERDVYEEFKNKTARKVSLTPLKNFARPIPESVLAEKKRCDEAGLYDGYAVMHYDDGKTVKETVKEKVAREKDPILFGVVRYSSRLYFVDDWEDEFCDLTLDDIIDKMNLTDEDTTLERKITLE